MRLVFAARRQVTAGTERCGRIGSGTAFLQKYLLILAQKCVETEFALAAFRFKE